MLASVPLTIWMSPPAKPVTASLKVMRKGISAALVGLADELVMLVDGRVRSLTSDNGVAAVFAFVAASRTTPLGSRIVTRPSAKGVTLNRYELPLPVRSLTVPLATRMSDSVRPLTASLNCNWIGIVASFVGLLIDVL